MSELIGTVTKVIPSKIIGKDLYHIKTPGNNFAVLVFEAGRYDTGDQIFGERVALKHELERLSEKFDASTTAV